MEDGGRWTVGGGSSPDLEEPRWQAALPPTTMFNRELSIRFASPVASGIGERSRVEKKGRELGKKDNGGILKDAVCTNTDKLSSSTYSSIPSSLAQELSGSVTYKTLVLPSAPSGTAAPNQSTHSACSNEQQSSLRKHIGQSEVSITLVDASPLLRDCFLGWNGIA